MKTLGARKVAACGILIAMAIVLSRFLSINAWNIKIGFTFVPVFVAGYLFGPLGGVLVGGLADFLGATIFPIGPYFPGFTLTCALTGLMYGLLFGGGRYKKYLELKIVLGTLANQLILSLLLNSLWISILYSSPFSALIVTRSIQCVIMTAVEILMLFLLNRLLMEKLEKVVGSYPKKEERVTGMERALAIINKTRWKGSVLGLSRMEELMERLDHPERKLQFVHIAGTNGKGSAAAMTASILREAGFKTGLYTSPHLERYNERININGEDISDEDFCEVAEIIGRTANLMEDGPTEFEVITAMAILYFAQQKCDIVVIETGLGGRLDASNIIPPPLASVIMNIGLEHTEYLGDTLEQIAGEKAGIIKTGSDAVVYPGTKEVEAVYESVCQERGAGLHKVEFALLRPLESGIDGQYFSWGSYERLYIPLLGEHQLKNAAVVLETVEVLRKKGLSVSDVNIMDGLRNVGWHARLEVLKREPLIIQDGAHNPQCVESMTQAIGSLFPDKKFIFLVGVLKDKDYRSMISMMIPYAEMFVCVTPEDFRGLPAKALAEEITGQGVKAVAADDIPSAVKKALALAKEHGDIGIVTCGSLYMASEVKAAFDSCLKK